MDLFLQRLYPISIILVIVFLFVASQILQYHLRLHLYCFSFLFIFYLNSPFDLKLNLNLLLFFINFSELLDFWISLKTIISFLKFKNTKAFSFCSYCCWQFGILLDLHLFHFRRIFNSILLKALWNQLLPSRSIETNLSICNCYYSCNYLITLVCAMRDY